MNFLDNESGELIRDILAPHTEHPFASCSLKEGDDICESCTHDLGISLATAAERERLKAAANELAAHSGNVVLVSEMLALSTEAA